VSGLQGGDGAHERAAVSLASARLRSKLAWLIVLPLALTGAELGHALANELCGSPTEAHELFQGYGQQLLLPFSALAVAAVAVGLGGRIAGRRPGRGPGALPFALIAPLLFVVQEHAELLLEHHGGPLAAERAPAFAVGLALQAPFAATAYLVARTLLRLADEVRALVAQSRSPLRLFELSLPALRLVPVRPYALLRGASRSGRAPPALLSAAAA
jgi:hypothetical protein